MGPEAGRPLRGLADGAVAGRRGPSGHLGRGRLPGPGPLSGRPPTAPLPAPPRERGEGPRRLVLPAPPRLGPARPLPRLRGRVGVGATGAIAPTRDPPLHATTWSGHPSAHPHHTGPGPAFRRHPQPQ